MKRILYVEDDAINALVMQKLLKGEYALKHVLDGELCLKIMADEKFDLVLMDINLGKGKMDGVETMHRIKRDKNLNHIPVVTVTSYALPEDEERFLNEGFDGYIAKPVERQHLLNTLSRYLS